MSLDIIFISYNEPNAEENWEDLKSRFPYALRVDMVDGIPEAFIEAARISKTSHVYTVDADNKILPGFKFEYSPNYWDKDFVHLWYAHNPVNGLMYGYGGLKLWPRRFLKEAQIQEHSVDFTVPASHGGQGGLKIHETAASITCFNTSRFDSYRAGFREGAKLRAEIVNESYYHDITEAKERLNIWCTQGENKPFGRECMYGALDGRSYGEKYSVNPKKLSLINSFDFIRSQFQKYE